MTVHDNGADFASQLGLPETGVVITGGASGIGLATAHALAAVGRPVALWDINAEGAEGAARIIADRYGVRTAGLAVDLRNSQAVAPAAIATREALGTVGGIVHGAGTAEVTGIDGVTPDNWDAGLGLHARALLLITQAFREDLRANPGSAIVAIASINATLGNGTIPIYSAAKGAIISLVRSMADELAFDGVRINSVSPGQIDTPIMANTKAHLPGHFERRILLGRYGLPEELGRVIRFLLSNEASYITASQILVDGGNIHSQRQ
ncbi:NAD(P)-dependent dehydrogenase (short-subunit alcohol dehydrogenase family) [Sphingobium sp. OAS761]|uniref:SDR family NAD(P)-dependent oxidoreductase n=1 Tax=Sphingobium sp. OAS761 TaxID=2817901 RepID=UPI00209D47F4|nr:SDR family oxidoreductase [Sphingobium sp. OAS761]MCP1471777.1 NAD(P)-dependent dehydrogenase (short-subunit alcohol dehydrogenase family) [Sphingobium sp. OAS761]